MRTWLTWTAFCLFAGSEATGGAQDPQAKDGEGEKSAAGREEKTVLLTQGRYLRLDVEKLDPAVHNSGPRPANHASDTSMNIVAKAPSFCS